MCYAISTKGLTKRYGALVAAEDVTLEVANAEIFGLLGPNGSGKTTIIKMLTGLTQPTAGTIRIFGQDLSKHPVRIKRRIGHVYGNMAFYPELTAVDNLRFFGQFYGFSRRQLSERIEDMLHFSDLWGERTKPVGAYSQGMKQRLGIAKAMLHDPDIIYFDEATNGIDVEGVRDIRARVLQLRSRGKTVFIASHLLDQIELLCDRIALLREGQLLCAAEVGGFKSCGDLKLFKYHVHLAQPIACPQGVRTEVCYLGDSSVVLSEVDLESHLSSVYDAAMIERVEPTLEEACLWLLKGERSPAGLHKALQACILRHRSAPSYGKMPRRL